MASFLKNIFGSTSKVNNERQESRQSASKTTEDSTYWDKEIGKYLPENLINRGVIEAAYVGRPMHQRILGLAFLPYSRDHAVRWLTKAAEKNDRDSIFALQELANIDSTEVLIIWWSFKDFTNVLGSRTINMLNRVTEASINKYLFRNAIIIPFLNEASKLNANYTLFDYIRDNIDSDIVANTEILVELLNNEEANDEIDDDICELLTIAETEERNDEEDLSSTVEAMKAKLKEKK